MYHSHICFKTQVLKVFSLPRWSCPHRELFAIEKMATAGMGNKKIATTLGLPLSTTKRWLQRLRTEGEMVSHNAGRQGGAEARVSCFPSISRLTSLHLCVICAFILWGRTDQRLDCHRVVLFSRQCSKTSAGVEHRAQPPQRPEAHDGGAVASEAGDVSKYLVVSASLISWPSLM